MTREEAISTLRNVAWLGTDKKVGQVEEALQIAITALQTDGDCISRREAIRVASGYCHPANVAEELAKLPSVHPEERTEERTETHACDCISRRAAIDIVVYECGRWTGLAKEISKQIKQLPSVQPDNSCDGCKHENADDGVMVMCGFCKRSHLDCYERRTDETD